MERAWTICKNVVMGILGGGMSIVGILVSLALTYAVLWIGALLFYRLFLDGMVRETVIRMAHEAMK